mmetsp:Transcript_22629/g.53598  ORF Transcript_22629/g.53598 Transcript_22629/m.53598 type:complete len:306 (+) Transcript_22629:2280-3197(+)
MGQSEGIRPPSYLCIHELSLFGAAAATAQRSYPPSAEEAKRVTHSPSLRARCRSTARILRSFVVHGQISARALGSPRRARTSNSHRPGSWLEPAALAEWATLSIFTIRDASTGGGICGCAGGSSGLTTGASFGLVPGLPLGPGLALPALAGALLTALAIALAGAATLPALTAFAAEAFGACGRFGTGAGLPRAAAGSNAPGFKSRAGEAPARAPFAYDCSPLGALLRASLAGCLLERRHSRHSMAFGPLLAARGLRTLSSCAFTINSPERAAPRARSPEHAVPERQLPIRAPRQHESGKTPDRGP